jgi:hypothetical protein
MLVDLYIKIPTVLFIESKLFPNTDIQIAQLPDFVLEALSEKGPDFLEECRNDTTNRRGVDRRGYGSLPVSHNLSIQTPPIDKDDLFWSSIREQISDFKERTSGMESNEGSSGAGFTALGNHMNRGGMGG